MKLAVAGCKHTTRDFIAGLHRRGFVVDSCITIDEDKARQQYVAGYYDLRGFLEEEKIETYVAETYALSTDFDRESITELGIDVLLVIGWQRLIPEWLLGSLTVGAFGMHGSNKPLPHGRGRSPLNWSLIQDKDVFFTHLFQYLPGVDNGPVIGQQVFDITEYDTCLTLHHKNLLSMLCLCEEHLPTLLEGEIKGTPQPTEGATYYPKRGAEDGLIPWHLSTKDVYNLIRAVTKPFSGAFSFLDLPHTGYATWFVKIWRAIPFDSHIRWPQAQPGEIVEAFVDGTFIVKTGDTSLLVQEYQGRTIKTKDIGSCFHDGTMKHKKWDDLPY